MLFMHVFLTGHYEISRILIKTYLTLESKLDDIRQYGKDLILISDGISLCAETVNNY